MMISAFFTLCTPFVRQKKTGNKYSSIVINIDTFVKPFSRLQVFLFVMVNVSSKKAAG